MNIVTRLLSSLEKVFSTKAPTAGEFTQASCLKGERFSFQLALRYIPDEEDKKNFLSSVSLSVDCKAPFKTNIYSVENVQVDLPAYIHSDDYFISKEPGLYPDILRDIKTRRNSVRLPFGQWLSLWVEVEVPEDFTPGTEEIVLSLTGIDADIKLERSFSLKVIDAVLPKQELKVTLWFHNDCLIDYYGVESFSQKYWDILENYMDNYRRYGCNMILTPIFTPPLDTEIGGERTTVQLVDVTETEAGYSFGFDKLDRYIDLSHKHGIEYFEIAHLFTQWGAKATPKIVTTEGKRIFGWDVSATSQEYKSFIVPFIHELKAHLKELGVLDKCYFHISDEPNPENIDTYQLAHDVVAEHLADCNVMDALSAYRFYEEGLVKLPIVSITHVDDFIDKNVSPLWTYYCCGQSAFYESNRFIAMPSARNRILGLQLFKYNMDGFLQWGYNFWSSQHSKWQVDPYFDTSSGLAFPAGDSTIVYPLFDGRPAPSLRQPVFAEALQDLRALRLLEKYMPHDDIVTWLEKLSGQEIKFLSYPHGGEYLLYIREEINKKIEELL